MRERETCNTSNQGRVRERERVTTTERQHARHTHAAQGEPKGRVRERERVTTTERH